MIFKIDDKEYVTKTGAAAMLSVSLMTVHRWIEAGKLKVMRISPKKIFIEVSEVRKLISQ